MADQSEMSTHLRRRPSGWRRAARRPEPRFPYEHELVRRSRVGALVDASSGDERLDAVFYGRPWSSRRIVRAEFLVSLLHQGAGVRAVALRGAWIVGAVDLEARSIACPLLLERCRLEQPFNATETRAPAIRLHHCDVPEFRGDRLEVRELELDECRADLVSLVAAQVPGELSLRGYWTGEQQVVAVDAYRLVAGAVHFDGCTTKGEVRLVGARAARISFSGARLIKGEGRPALSADGIHVAGDMLFWRGEPPRRRPFQADGELRLTGARIGTLSMNAAEIDSCDPAVPALAADGLAVDVGIYLNEQFTAKGAVTLRGAQTHVLSLAEARLSNPDGVALEGDRLTARSGVFCDGMHVQGTLSIPDARITGTLSLANARLEGGAGRALRADRIRLDGSLFARGCRAEGMTLLRGAHVTGLVNLNDSELRSGGQAAALRAEQLVAGSGMSWRKCEIDGEASISGARVRGRFRLEDAKLRNGGKTALAADELSVEQQLLCDGAQFDGSVLLRGAEASMASFNSAILRNPARHVALDADGLTVHRDLFLNAMEATGTVRLCGAELGVLSLVGSKLRAEREQPVALDAEGLTVDRGVFAEELDARGTLKLADARIGGKLKLSDASLEPARMNGEATVLTLEGANVGSLKLRLRKRPDGTVNLTSTTLGALDVRPADEKETWSPRCRLSGCTYDSLTTALGSRARIAWLRSDPGGFSSQPYEELAATYRHEGRDPQARRVSIARHRTRRKWLEWRLRTAPGKLWGWFLDWTVGYGYRPWQAGLWLLALVVIGSVVFGAVYDVDHDGGTNAAGSEFAPARAADQVPPFQPVVYTVDVLVPVISLGQRVAWNASGSAQWFAFGMTLCGWLLTTALIAGLAARRQ